MGNFPRRAALGAGLAAAGTGLLGGCGTPSGGRAARGPAADPAPSWVRPDGPEARAARQHGTGRVQRIRLTPTETTVDLGGPVVRTWTYDGRLPGRVVRMTAGDTLTAQVANHLPRATTVHWHGIDVPNAMDGVPGLTQRAIAPGGQFTYSFTAPVPGTYWLHPHVGVQRDRGLYAPLIVDDPHEPLSYDREWVLVLDDWVDGVDGSTPERVMHQLSYDHGGRGGPRAADPADAGSDSGPDRRLVSGRSDLLGGHPGDVNYPYNLINGRVPHAPETFTAKPGDRIRLRILNAGGDTAFRVALGGHRMTITHTDGRPVEHRDTEALLIAMGERYDVLVTADDGVFPLVALAEGKGGWARALLRTCPMAEPPAPDLRPAELDGRLVTAGQLRAAPAAALSRRAADRTIRFRLTHSRGYAWGLNDRDYDPAYRYPVRTGERVRLALVNETRMWHPIHLHGQSFALPDGGPVKDTVMVLPGRAVEVQFDARNPGLWLLHCHNIYHAESGMMAVLGYLAGSAGG